MKLGAQDLPIKFLAILLLEIVHPLKCFSHTKQLLPEDPYFGAQYRWLAFGKKVLQVRLTPFQKYVGSHSAHMLSWSNYGACHSFITCNTSTFTDSAGAILLLDLATWVARVREIPKVSDHPVMFTEGPECITFLLEKFCIAVPEGLERELIALFNNSVSLPSLWLAL